MFEHINDLDMSLSTCESLFLQQTVSHSPSSKIMTGTYTSCNLRMMFAIWVGLHGEISTKKGHIVIKTLSDFSVRAAWKV